MSAYGLVVESDIDLPELRAFSGTVERGGVDIEVRYGVVDETLQDGARIETFMQVTDRACLYDFPAIGRFLVEDGARVTVQAAPEALDCDVRAYLFGSVMGTLLHQRGLVPLHLSAVRTPRGVWAFTGDSGAGKSTIASMLHWRTEWPIVCDDVGVLRPEEVAPVLRSGIRRLKLWDDAASRMGLSTDAMTRDVTRVGKFHLHAPDMFDDAPAELAALVYLERGSQVELSAAAGIHRFTGVMNALYRPYLVGMFGEQDRIVQKCALTANQIEVMTLQRPWSEAGLSQSVDRIIEAVASERTGASR